MDLLNKVAIVTGGSRGIGRSIVKKLCDEGATLIFTYLKDKVSADDLVRELNEKGSKIHCLQMDASKRKSVKTAIRHIEEITDKVDVLVN